MADVPADIVESALMNTTASLEREVAWEFDLINKTTKVETSEPLLRALNITKEEFNVFNWFEANLHPDDKKRVNNNYYKFLHQPNNTIDEDLYRVYNAHSKSYLWIHSYRKLHRNESGEPIRVSGVSRDITDSREVDFERAKQSDQYQFLVDSLSQVVFSLDRDGKFLFISNAWNPLSGFDPAYSLGHCLPDYLSQQHAVIFSMKLENLVAGRICYLDEQMQLINDSSEKIWVRLFAKASYNKDNQISGAFGTIENINDKYNAGLLLQESNEKMNAILNNSKEIILTINLEKKVIENVNEAISILGYKPYEWIGKNYRTWKDDQRQKFHELTRRAVDSALEVKNQQITFPHKNTGENIAFEFSTSIFYLKQTKYLLCVLRDIRERLKYEDNINKISDQLHHLINNIDDVYAIYDIPSNTYDFVSENITALYDCNKETYAENPLFWQQVIFEEDRTRVEKAVADIITKKGKGDILYRVVTGSGETRTIREKLVVGNDKDGNANKLYIVKTDHTQIAKSEKSLLETERMFRFISQNLSDFISIHNAEWDFTYASPSIKNILGFEPTEVEGMGGFDLVHPEDLIKTLDEAIEPIVLHKREIRLRCRLLTKSGTYKWVEMYSKPILDSQGETSSIISSTRDVSDQVVAENKLKENEDKYRLCPTRVSKDRQVVSFQSASTDVPDKEQMFMELKHSLENETELGGLQCKLNDIMKRYLSE